MRTFARLARPVVFAARTAAASRPAFLAQPLVQRAAITPLFNSQQVRLASGLSKADITSRIVEVLKSFEKVDATKLSESSSFTGDLGLDSLDAVEVVMAIEEEFSIEIPDDEADAISTVQEAIDYISKTPDAH